MNKHQYELAVKSIAKEVGNKSREAINKFISVKCLAINPENPGLSKFEMTIHWDKLVDLAGNDAEVIKAHQELLDVLMRSTIEQYDQCVQEISKSHNTELSNRLKQLGPVAK